jgi:hypothetical protein
VKYLVIILLVLALIGVGAYFGLTYYKSTPKFPVNTTTETTQTSSNQVSQASVDETEPSDDVTALDRDLSDTDSLDTEFRY